MKTTLLFLSLLLTSVFAWSQVSAGQVDDFEDGTTQTWVVGNSSPNPTTNIASGGPNGVDDNFLSFTTTGSGGGAGSKMVIYTRNAQWSGNFTSEGIVAIKFDVRATTADLNLRFGISDQPTTVGGTQIVSTNAVVVTAGSGWQSVTIPISASDFTQLGGGNTIAGVLTSVAETRIISNESATWLGQSGLRTMDLDNITASTTLSSSEIENENNFEISPNPATSKLNINLSQNLDDATITVYDVLGKKVHAQELNNLSSSIDVSNWNSGVYLVRISTNKETLTKRFVKQ